jgi:hypothetical protein
MVSLSNRRLLLCPFRSSTASLRLLLHSTRALYPLLVLLPSLHSLRSPNRSCFIGSPSGLKIKFVGSRRTEQLNLRSQQRIVATVEESVLRMEMVGLESQEEDATKRVLFFKPMSWLGQIRSHRRDESWSASL